MSCTSLALVAPTTTTSPPGPYGGAYVTGDPEARGGGTPWGAIVGVMVGIGALFGLIGAYFKWRQGDK